MVKNIIVIAIAVCAISCNQKKIKKDIKEKYPSGKTKIEAFFNYRIEVKDTINTELVKEIRYFEDGKKEMEGDYKDNKRNGWWIAYFPNGNKQSEGEFKDGLGNGKRIVYFENGKIRYTGFFKSGLPDGKWEMFDSEGKKIKEIDYVNGKVKQEKNY